MTYQQASASKYIGGFPSDTEFRAVDRREVNRVIDDYRHLGATRAEARRACMKILHRGDLLTDRFGFSVRLRHLPA